MELESLKGTGALALGASVPSLLMVWWAMESSVLTLLDAIRAFLLLGALADLPGAKCYRGQ